MLLKLSFYAVEAEIYRLLKLKFYTVEVEK